MVVERLLQVISLRQIATSRRTDRHVQAVQLRRHVCHDIPGDSMSWAVMVTRTKSGWEEESL